MTTTAISTTQRMVSRVKGVWQELDYAQRRLLEIRTGLPLGDSKSVRGQRTRSQVH